MANQVTAQWRASPLRLRGSFDDEMSCPLGKNWQESESADETHKNRNIRTFEKKSIEQSLP
jgi:hypothetical protein